MGLDLNLYKIPKTKEGEVKDILKKYNDWFKSNLCNDAENYIYDKQLGNIAERYEYFGSNGWFIVNLLQDHGINIDECEIAVEMPQSLVDYLIDLKQKLQNIVEQNPELVEFDAFNEFPIDVDNDNIYVVEANW